MLRQMGKSKNSPNLVKLTSITFLFQFLNSFSIYFPILILFLLKLNHSFEIASELIELNDEYVKNLYFKNLVKQDLVEISFKNNTYINYNQLQTLLDDDSIKYSRSIQITEFVNVFKSDPNSTLNQNLNLVDLFFPKPKYGHRLKIEKLIQDNSLKISKFRLELLNLTRNGLQDSFLENDQSNNKPSTLFNLILSKYFTNLRLLILNHNKFTNLERKHFELFTDGSNSLNSSKLETVLLSHNQIRTVKHDTFYDLINLKYLDLSFNYIKLVHPLTFSSLFNLNLINLKSNQLKTIHKPDQINFKYIYLENNNNIKCDLGLSWLLEAKDQIIIDNFECDSSQGLIKFKSIESKTFLANNSNQKPNLVIDTTKFDETSEISLIRSWSKKWFAWTVFVDHLPVTTPFPYLMTIRNKSEDETYSDFDQAQDSKHVFHAWLYEDAVFECSNKNYSNFNSSLIDDSKSAIIWKTQYGYLSNIDEDLISGDEQQINETNYLNSYKIFYKMNHLTKIYKNLTVRISSKFGAESKSLFYVNNKQQLIVTNMRQLVSGPFVCISINEHGIRTYEYDIKVRTGVSEYFIYSLFVSIISMIIPSIIGIIVCCVCEYQADKNYPMTPPCYPTPMASTPPNFDFNEWMANAASYLPNLNIHETLEQVSKRLRKGMEKASVTVKSLGLTSTAYIYSMYEQSSQRFYDLKQYVPSLNVPTLNLNLPTMKYPPGMGQLANRMKMGMGNMFIQLREFCGTSDLSHTPSIVDIQTDCSASNAVGKTYIMDQFNLNKSRSTSNQHNFYRFLNLIKEDSKFHKNKFNINQNNSNIIEENEASNDLSEPINIDETKPSTSGLNLASALSSKSNNQSLYRIESYEESDSDLDIDLPKNDQLKNQESTLNQ